MQGDIITVAKRYTNSVNARNNAAHVENNKLNYWFAKRTTQNNSCVHRTACKQLVCRTDSAILPATAKMSAGRVLSGRKNAIYTRSYGRREYRAKQPVCETDNAKHRVCETDSGKQRQPPLQCRIWTERPSSARPSSKRSADQPA